MIKVNKLYDLATELGISISWLGHCTIIEDNERDRSLPNIRLEDIESNDQVGEWPPATEFKLVYDNPAYLAEQKREYDERCKQQAKAAELRKKEQKEAEAKCKAKELKEKEEAERKLYLKLKAQYGE
jgi:hypothetical protein